MKTIEKRTIRGFFGQKMIVTIKQYDDHYFIYVDGDFWSTAETRAEVEDEIEYISVA